MMTFCNEDIKVGAFLRCFLGRKYIVSRFNKYLQHSHARLQQALSQSISGRIISVLRYFNSLQSEFFPTCYFSDVNMVISAPTASGKAVLFELCIMRLQLRELKGLGKK